MTERVHRGYPLQQGPLLTEPKSRPWPIGWEQDRIDDGHTHILRDGKTNERCLFGLDHCWSAIGDAMACGRCGRLSGPTARTLHVDQNTVKVNIHEFGWLVYLSEAVAS